MKNQNQQVYILPILLPTMGKTKIKCTYEDCLYEWNTSSKAKFVSCPSCMRKVKSDWAKQNKKNETKKTK